MNIALRIGKIVLIVVAAIVAVVAVLLLYLTLSARVWYPRQRGRVQEVREQPIEKLDEDRFAVAPLDDQLPMNRLQMIATHNSYHLEPEWIRKALIGIVEPEEPAKLSYSHRPLWDQLQGGIRSFELDVRYNGSRFTITHVPLVDSRGPHPDFVLALAEIVAWSERHPGHVPIVVLLELKSDWMFLNPFLKEWDSDALAKLDGVIRSSIPSGRLLTPDRVRGTRLTLSAAIRAEGWPALGEVRDTIMVILHTDDALDPLYVNVDPSLAGRPMFTSFRPDAPREDAVIVIHNDPDQASIAELTSRGFLVRTRADGDGVSGGPDRSEALGSRAQLISTAYPPGHINGERGETVSFSSGATLQQWQ
ncbi:MAG: hypothetical protein E4H09_04855 [Spirochaetales bacterium]|nr:MAG: hypothetical protein E4H09_04855 [Spirochaetales bacterium]